MWVPYGVHDYLTGIYGDYMKMPPKSKRIRGKCMAFNLGKYETAVSYADMHVEEI